jgi:glycerol-3-phosphate dehydrogenase (NAD(P)+)
MSNSIAVLGAGSWGTALAIQCARSGRETHLWGRDTTQLAAMAAQRENRRYLPGAAFPPALTLASNLAAAVDAVRDILIAVPSHAFRDTLVMLRPLLRADMRVCWATKGFEIDSGKLPHQVANDVLGSRWPTAVVSGPTFAREVGAGLPSAMTIASSDEEFAAAFAHSLATEKFRMYTATDIIGVETGGAVKNVLAVGAGMSDGLGFGANTRIALITRGLFEMTRLGVALGARRETFMGLAGLGDLVLTCTDNQSRNRRFGLLLAEGRSVEAAQAEIGQVVEGYRAARAVHSVAARHKVDMPIADSIYSVLYEGRAPRDAVRDLMLRPVRAEHD